MPCSQPLTGLWPTALRIVLVSGYSGVGKSSVVNELHRVLVPPRGLFASGKFDQYKRDIPYTTLAQAFRSLVRPLLGQSEAELGRWQAALSEALGSNGQLIVNLVPELELAIGKQPPVAQLPPLDAQNRFQMVFRRFLGVFARKEHPLALFLDDLQWLDTATLDLLEHLVTHSEVQHLLLVGAYRDNEVGTAHPLMRTLAAIRDAGSGLHEIVLAPLRIDDVGRLVADALHCEPERARPLAQLVHEKTGGNPFFAIQFFTALADEGLLTFGPVTRAWQWDIDRIRARSYTDNVVDLMMSDPELQATTQALEALLIPAYYTDFHLFCLHLCLGVNISLQHGTSGASAIGCGWLGTILGPVFRRYNDGYRFAKLACDLVEKHGFIASQAKVHYAMGLAALWTQPITTAFDFNRAAFRTGIETGALTYACYSVYESVTILLLRNDPLDEAWRESEAALDFARKASFRDQADAIVSQQRFIATMQGRTATFSTFSDASFDETAFEAQLMTEDRMHTMVCFYWILKLKARFLSGDYAEALAAADKAKELLWSGRGHIVLLDYYCYAALIVAALYENASADERTRWRELLTAHREQLREWAANYPPTFADKHALVSAEIARLEGRGFDAMHAYEQAIQSAREHGFVQNEGLAHEVAARYYLAHGLETSGYAHLRNARNCYDRWRAHGKVRQLDELYPRLHHERLPASTTATIGAQVSELDVETVVKASQALSSEIVLNKLIEKLMRIAVEHAGAERGLLILLRGDDADRGRGCLRPQRGRGKRSTDNPLTARSSQIRDSVCHSDRGASSPR
jgi:AAA ATPase domain